MNNNQFLLIHNSKHDNLICETEKARLIKLARKSEKKNVVDRLLTRG